MYDAPFSAEALRIGSEVIPEGIIRTDISICYIYRQEKAKVKGILKFLPFEQILRWEFSIFCLEKILQRGYNV